MILANNQISSLNNAMEEQTQAHQKVLRDFKISEKKMTDENEQLRNQLKDAQEKVKVFEDELNRIKMADNSNSRPQKCSDCKNALNSKGVLKVNSNEEMSKNFYNKKSIQSDENYEGNICFLQCFMIFHENCDINRLWFIFYSVLGENIEEENEDPLPNSDKDLSNNSEIKQKEKWRKKQRVRKEPICTICEKTFSKLSNMKAHRNICHEPPEIECDICGKMMYRKDQLKLHRANKHSNKKQFYCK